MTDRCETCGWWERFVPKSELGVCKRNAPMSSTMFDRNRLPQAQTVWPETCQNDSCGEHTAIQRRRDRLMLAGQAMNAIVRVHAGDMTEEKEIKVAFRYADGMLKRSDDSADSQVGDDVGYGEVIVCSLCGGKPGSCSGTIDDCPHA